MIKKYALDIYLYNTGENFKAYEVMGAHPTEEGYEFLVWAPLASKVALVGDFNDWQEDAHILKQLEETGMWYIEVSGLKTLDLYKYAIEDQWGQVKLKADPFAFYSEVKPATASRVFDLSNYDWQDHDWMIKRATTNYYKSPLNVYELHFGSWRRRDGSYLTYKALEEELIPYIVQHQYTHIEIMPLTEHPFDGSWGYQATGYFSITSRYGTPKEFMSFVDACHKYGIGVILDWVPCHFCNDEHGLRRFDGTETFEHVDSKFADNELWGTTNFDYAKTQVQSFLISNALFFLDKFHIDGLRVDAVAFMLYQGYTTHQSEVNQGAVRFLQKLNKEVFARFPDVLMIAEESSAWPMVTAPIHDGGLGFNFKWNMGWMNDMLEYMALDYDKRHHAHKAITFSLMYAFTENFILPLSHDEVVHGKKSLLNKMPGDYWQKFANLRMFYGYMYAYPGKKLLFMGGEIGQFIEWDYKKSLDWFIEDYDKHAQLHTCVKKLNELYISQEALSFHDDQYKGFEWIDYANSEQSIISFVRNSDDEHILVVCNFTPEVYDGYELGAPYMGTYKEVLNTDDESFGGSGYWMNHEIESIKTPKHGRPQLIRIKIPPLATMYFKIKKQGEMNETV